MLLYDLRKNTGKGITSSPLINRYMSTEILSEEYDYRNRLFALCEKCYWTATILKKVETYQCPVCHSDEVSLIPIGNDERYEYSLEARQGLQI
ncbi:MAG: hypothetical protein QOK76_07635, partial [Nitrososphaeraceae archaeon]|nr:hypothetical protein [Nitrososphaeraceae archaeon]